MNLYWLEPPVTDFSLAGIFGNDGQGWAVKQLHMVGQDIGKVVTIARFPEEARARAFLAWIRDQEMEGSQMGESEA